MFHVHKLTVVALALCALFVTGCASTYQGPVAYVDFRSDNKIKSSSESSLVGDSDSVRNTYADEFVYDTKGNVIKHRQTEYFWTDKKKDSDYVVWETEFKLVGDTLLPSKISVNGVSFLEVEYEVLSAQTKGSIDQDVRERSVQQRFYRGIPLLGGGWVTNDWAVNLEDFPVDFRADDKFIVKKSTYSPYSGFGSDNYLTLGYDNIVLKRYWYSVEKRTEGFVKSFPSGSDFWKASASAAAKDSNFEFKYDWNVIGGRICQLKAQFTRKIGSSFDIDFVANSKYNDAGQRIEEIWTANDSRSKKQEPVVIFKQALTY